MDSHSLTLLESVELLCIDSESSELCHGSILLPLFSSGVLQHVYTSVTVLEPVNGTELRNGSVAFSPCLHQLHGTVPLRRHAMAALGYPPQSSSVCKPFECFQALQSALRVGRRPSRSLAGRIPLLKRRSCRRRCGYRWWWQSCSRL